MKEPEAVFQALDLPQPASIESRPDGGQIASVEMPRKYSRLVLAWDASGEPSEFAWEVDSPAVDQVAWQSHLASFEVE